MPEDLRQDFKIAFVFAAGVYLGWRLMFWCEKTLDLACQIAINRKRGRW